VNDAWRSENGVMQNDDAAASPDAGETLFNTRRCRFDTCQTWKLLF
jgi:hypothetical protein